VVRPRITDLGLVIALALVACLVAAVLPPSLALLRAPLALPLALALPGYAVVTATFQPGALRVAELVTLSLAVSIAATIGAGLLLALFGVALSAAPWIAVLAVLTIAACARGITLGHARPIATPRLKLRGAEIGALAGALALLSGAAALGFTPLPPPSATRGTSALWLLPAPAGRSAVCVGVINEQKQLTRYTVTLAVVGGRPQRFGPITLEPAESWSRVVSVHAGKPVVTASLATTLNPGAAYRTVALRDWNIAASNC
jgi:uncharacterized membrane protein